MITPSPLHKFAQRKNLQQFFLDQKRPFLPTTTITSLQVGFFSLQKKDPNLGIYVSLLKVLLFNPWMLQFSSNKTQTTQSNNSFMAEHTHVPRRPSYHNIMGNNFFLSINEEGDFCISSQAHWKALAISFKPEFDFYERENDWSFNAQVTLVMRIRHVLECPMNLPVGTSTHNSSIVGMRNAYFFSLLRWNMWGFMASVELV